MRRLKEKIDDMGAEFRLMDSRPPRESVLSGRKQVVDTGWCNDYTARYNSHALTIHAKATRDERSHHGKIRSLVHKRGLVSVVGSRCYMMKGVLF
jgi:hypothetical protein